MRIYFLFILSLLFFGCETGQTIEVDLNEKIIIPKHYVVSKTSDPILIDGMDNEKVWNQAKYSDDFIDIEGLKTPTQKTNVKLLWDKNYLYVFAKLFENHIWGDITERDDVIFYNNDFEVFINPNNHVFSYGEIEINALGTVWDLYLNRPYRLKGMAISTVQKLSTSLGLLIVPFMFTADFNPSIFQLLSAFPFNRYGLFRYKSQTVPKAFISISP